MSKAKILLSECERERGREGGREGGNLKMILVHPGN
jgi:hypothetical protein